MQHIKFASFCKYGIGREIAFLWHCVIMGRFWDGSLTSPCLQDKLFVKQTPHSFRTVLGPKVHGLLAIATRLSALPLSSLMIFSSVSSLVAPLGQPNYASANAIMNTMANFHKRKVSMPLKDVNIYRRLKSSWVFFSKTSIFKVRSTSSSVMQRSYNLQLFKRYKYNS